MSNTIVVGYDGSDSSLRALNFAVDRAKAEKAELIVAHVLEWSPYAFLTPTELEERHKRRGEELDRANKHVLEPLTKRLSDTGVKVTTELRYGRTADTLCSIAAEKSASQIIIGRTGGSGIAARLFGAVAGSVAQVATVPVTIVP
ncbi:universal stress protein [Pseudohalocynthiibacter aestuariivivens]|uniref:Universal stress protein n=1 Tax=Roseovarius pelagicus TaxID=2980108 RepID=A0ABY6D9W7_9RHOB|nr:MULTISPECIES: universal stress protein [Rhodobacterales]QIE45131.1 universal stress protein [Pseudohalocynthiibacter aestuariivivens]UXX82931.1 universal stress protein [Roseovarius pelagicus]